MSGGVSGRAFAYLRKKRVLNIETEREKDRRGKEGKRLSEESERGREKEKRE